MQRLSDEQLAELRGIAEAATPGPWEADGNEVSQHWSRPEPWEEIASSEVVCMAYCYGGSARGIERNEDAAHVAAFDPPTVLALLAEVAECRAREAESTWQDDAMGERIDHVAEARRLLAAVDEVPTDAAGVLPIDVWATEAQAHATLALVEQQRIANLIALSQAEDGNGWLAEQSVSAVFREHWNDEQGQGHCTIAPDIAAALGITTGDNNE